MARARFIIWALATIALTIVCAAPVSAAQSAAEQAYFKGLTALEEKQFHQALDLFERALSAGGSPELRSSILRAYGHAAEQVVEADRELACQSVRYYREWLGAAQPEHPKRESVVDAMGKMQRLCAASAIPVRTTPSRDSELVVLGSAAGAALIGGIVCTAMMISAQADYERDAGALATEANAERQAILYDRLAQADSTVEALESASVGFYVAAGVLVAGAAWVWWSSEPAASGLTVGVSPGGVIVGGQW